VRFIVPRCRPRNDQRNAANRAAEPGYSGGSLQSFQYASMGSAEHDGWLLNFGSITTTGGPRVGQLAVKLNF